MSSYDKYFVGIWKYGSSAFQRTIDHVSMTSKLSKTVSNTFIRCPICWPHCWLKSVEISILLLHLSAWSSPGWVLMKNIFLVSESMEHQLSNALSTMFLRHLVTFLHFETYALANPQKAWFSGGSGPQLDFLESYGVWGFSNTCVSKCRNLTRFRRDMVHTS